MRGSGGSWTVKPIAGTTNGTNDLCADAGGQLHLVARGSKGSTIVYRRYSSGAWKPEVVLSIKGPTLGRKPAVAVDSGGQVHVTHSTSDGQLIYLVGQGSAFGGAKVLGTGLEDVGSAMTLDDADRAHVIFNDKLTAQLMYTAQHAAGGSFDKPTTLGKLGTMATSYFGNYADLVHGDGVLWVVFADKTNQLTVRRRTKGGAWQAAQQPGWCCGSMISAALDPTGALHVVHWDVTPDRLRHTRLCP